MNYARIAALKISLILEEYKPEELKKAVEILRDSGRSGILLDYLADERSHASRRVRKPGKLSTGRSQLLDSEQRPKALLQLEESEPEKFDLLSELDNLIKSGKILRTNEAVRSLGERVSKSFVGKKTKRESITSLYEVLAESDIDNIRNIIEVAIAPHTHVGDDNYRRLAEFLIKGK